MADGMFYLDYHYLGRQFRVVTGVGQFAVTVEATLVGVPPAPHGDLIFRSFDGVVFQVPYCYIENGGVTVQSLLSIM